jgi:hypothetical protein
MGTNFTISQFNVDVISSNELPLMKMLVSSANCMQYNVNDILGNLLTCIRNSSGPKIEPCGTPISTPHIFDLVLLYTNPLYKKLKILKLEDIYKLKVAKYMYAFDKQILPSPLLDIISYNHNIHEYNTRNNDNTHIDTRRTMIASNSLRHKGPEIWYEIPEIIKSKKNH